MYFSFIPDSVDLGLQDSLSRGCRLQSYLEWTKIAPLVLKYADLNNPTWLEALTVPHLGKSIENINTFLIQHFQH